MKKRSVILTGLLVGALCLSAVGCGAKGTDSKSEGTEKTDNKDAKVVTVAVSADIIPSMERVEEPLRNLGYEMEVTTFDDWVMPNTALAEGSVDCNFFEHEPYMEQYNQSKGADLVMIEPKIYSTPYGFFSEKLDSLDKLGKDLKVAMSSEPSNRSRSMLLLQEAGLLKLADTPKDEYYDEVDVVDNPHNFSFSMADSNSLFSMIPEMDLVVMPCDLVNNAGGDASKALYREQDLKYAMGIAVKKGNENNEGVLALNEAFHTKEFRDALEKDYPGVYLFVE